MYFLFKKFCNFWSPAELELFSWSQIRLSVENNVFQGSADIFKTIVKRAGLRCLTERSTTQQKSHPGRIAAFSLRSVCPLCTERTGTFSPLITAARASQWKRVYSGTVRVCTELWSQFQAPFPLTSLTTCCCQFQTILQLPLLLFMFAPTHANTLLPI